MQSPSVRVTIAVPLALADAGAVERARVLLVLDAVRSDRITWRAGATALGLAPSAFLDLARDHGVPVACVSAADVAVDPATLEKLPEHASPRRWRVAGSLAFTLAAAAAFICASCSGRSELAGGDALRSPDAVRSVRAERRPVRVGLEATGLAVSGDGSVVVGFTTARPWQDRLALAFDTAGQVLSTRNIEEDTSCSIGTGGDLFLLGSSRSFLLAPPRRRMHRVSARELNDVVPPVPPLAGTEFIRDAICVEGDRPEIVLITPEFFKGDRLVRIDARDLSVTTSMALAMQARVWCQVPGRRQIVACGARDVALIDLDTAGILSRREVPGSVGVTSVCVAGTRAWLGMSGDGGEIVEVNLAGSLELRRLPVGPAGATLVAMDPTRSWLCAVATALDVPDGKTEITTQVFGVGESGLVPHERAVMQTEDVAHAVVVLGTAPTAVIAAGREWLWLTWPRPGDPR